ncbi:MAG: YncE family protein [Chthoniobacterales bacterium]
MRARIFLAMALCGLGLTTTGATNETEYQFVTEIPIGGEGGWDILTIDPAAHRLYLSHATKVIVVDLDKNEVVGEISDTPGVHGFVAIPELGRGFSTNGRESKASVVNLKTLQTINKVATGANPDALVYDPGRAEVYVFNHTGNSATVIDARTAKVLSTIPLGGSPEFAVVDPAAGRVYCNLEDKGEVVAIDTTRHEVTARWPVAPGAEPGGLAFDPAHHRLFASCHNKLMVMLDSASGRVIGSVPIGSRVDGCVFDEATQLVFASCGDGTTTIAKEETPEKLAVVQTLRTEPGARTIALDPSTHRIYLPSAKFAPPSPASPGATPPRPKIVPGSLKLLVYGPNESATR